MTPPNQPGPNVPPYTYPPPAAYPPPGAYPGYFAPPVPPRRDHTLLIVVIVIVVVVAVSAISVVFLYIMTSGLISGPGPSKPVVAFSTPSVSAGTATLTVAGASQAVSYTNFRMNLGMDAGTGMMYGTAMPLSGSNTPMSMSMTMGMTMYSFQVMWNDRDASGTINPGDMFTVTQTGGFLSGSPYQFMLLWNDGSLIAQTNWMG